MTELSEAIQDAIQVLQRHPAVLSVRVADAAESGWIIAEADFDTDLPSTWRAEGQSPTGVLPIETVKFEFPPDYPVRAPHPMLRPTFNSSLAHINPHVPGDPVPPCLVYGSLLDVLHNDGFYRIVDQMAIWLSKAAMGTLIDPDQGWEPTRRMDTAGRLDVDVHSLIANRPALGGLQLFRTFAAWWPDRRYLIASSIRFEAQELQAPGLNRLAKNIKADEKHEWGNIYFAICWPNGGLDAQPVFEAYQPDTVTTVTELRARAKAVQCDTALENLLAIGTLMKGQGIRKMPPTIVVFPIRRPQNLLGLDVPIEFLGYIIDIERNGSETSLKGDAKARSISLRTPITQALLRSTSGLPQENGKYTLAFVGCGSFGSKVTMHVTRAGFCPGLLIDGSYSSAHHVARHAFLPSDTKKIETKAAGLGRKVEEFAVGKPDVYGGKVQYLPADLRDKYFYGASRLIINTTASPAVRSYLNEQGFSARVVEACGFEQGKSAVLTVEGEGRSPTTGDLMAYAYEVMRHRGLLPAPTHGRESVLGIGVGCNSVTLPMADARVSLLTAGVGQVLLNALTSGLEEFGRVSVGVVANDDISIGWDTHNLGETHIVSPAFSPPGWVVRVLDPVHQELVQSCAKYPRVETGGIIVGRVSPTSREVIITGLLPAPPDSTRTPNTFVLGIQGRDECIAKYEDSARGVLWVLGTWHSHLRPEGPSATDLATAKALENIRPGVSVMLIKRPDGYSAVIRNSE